MIRENIDEKLNYAKKIIKENNVKYLRLIITDIHGTPKSVIIRSEEIEDAVYYGVGFDGSSIPGFARIENSDLIAIPDLSTLKIALWEDNRTAVVICDTYTPEYKLYEGSPRTVLKKVLETVETGGFNVKAGIELEYFIINKNERLEIKPQDNGQYFDSIPLDYGDYIKKILGDVLLDLNIEFDKMHHEVAPGQHEVSISAPNPVTLADLVIIIKMAIKALARKEGYIATFMPKPFMEVNGSGAHLHLSLQRNGRNLFYSGGNEISSLALNFIGGLLRHSKGLSLTVAPLVNSYKRLRPGYEAPVYICWGYSNRSTLIRVPRPIREKTCRIEYRHPDPSFNPYLGLATVITAGIYGVKSKIDPGEPYNLDVYHHKGEFETLPGSLIEAIEEFKKDETVNKCLGEHVFNKLVEIKMKEWEKYIKDTGSWEESKDKVTKWEIEMYLERA